MIAPLWRYVGIGVAGLLLVVGIYASGYGHAKSKYKARLEEQRAVWQADYDKQAAETARIQAEWDSSKEREHDIQERLNVVSADGITLAQRLRDYARRRVCPVPQTPGSAPVADGTSGESADSSGIDAATERHFAACGRDAERLTQFQQFYESLRSAQ